MIAQPCHDIGALLGLTLDCHASWRAVVVKSENWNGTLDLAKRRPATLTKIR